MYSHHYQVGEGGYHTDEKFNGFGNALLCKVVKLHNLKGVDKISQTRMVYTNL